MACLIFLCALRIALVLRIRTIFDILFHSVEILPGDELYERLIRWKSAQTSSQTEVPDRFNQNWNASRQTNTQFLEDKQGLSKPHIDPELFTYSPPWANTLFIWFKNHPLILQINHDKGGGAICITSLWLYGSDIGQFLQEVEEMSIDGYHTIIFRGQTLASERGNAVWERTAIRLPPSLFAFGIGRARRHALLEDLNEFLSPAAVNWYSEHGIPYRRGYLLWGEPGSGKNSLCLAISGLFALNIYTINVASQQLSGTDYVVLFRSLPRRCFLLLQNIDMLDSALVPHLIDLLVGLDAKEGRVLVLTSTERTVPRLFRQSRCIDMIIPMTSVTRSMTQDIFFTAYAGLTFPSCQSGDPGRSPLSESGVYSKARIKRLAEEFSKKFPIGVFYASDIENYLLMYKTTPEDAVMNVDNWICEYS
ncbi:hypothetical protein ASPBRDRAFT_35081 [Aspergillus brasiliensis CBS 101740]|uniref:BCS1 N-terminal domain-containing protein n=1 Tax=Aspergillus brasiliensis (strain CBS 101740 / IMI 381727 / IBT 21946) TaxID=767769 RepID=A0A1L9U3U1_ASPBC|nr:hypothetical protein ASPBRDRAFT_35081 [Aspergillus brasiliensis CBS 101740]